MEIITRLVKRFCTAAAAITFIFILSMQALAISVDGIVSHDEVHSANVQMQCENKNGGNGTLVTYYTKTESGSLYVAMSGDISYAELTDESPIVYEIYIDGNDPIKIDITGKAEYDEQLFSVKSRAKFEGDGMTCEALIDRKYSFGADPEIFVRVTDDNGIPSKMFEIDTYIAPPETTAEQSEKSNSTKPESRAGSTKTGRKSSSDKSSAEKESTTKKKKKSSRSKTSSKSKAKTTKAKSKATKTRYKTTKSKSKTTNAGTSNSEQFASARELANDSVINYDGEIETYTLPNSGSTRNAARVKQGVTAVGITVIVATMVSISLLMFKKSGKK